MERQRELDLAGKVVIITGASRGVGKQAALDFARRGAHVVLAARTVEADGALPGTIGETLAADRGAGRPGDRGRHRPRRGRRSQARWSMPRSNASAASTSSINNAAATTGDIWGKPFSRTDARGMALPVRRQHARALHADPARRADHGEARRRPHHQPLDRQRRSVPPARGAAQAGRGRRFQPGGAGLLFQQARARPLRQLHGARIPRQEHRDHRHASGSGRDRTGRDPGEGKGPGRQRRGADDGAGAHAGLFRGLRKSVGIHRPPVLGRARDGRHGHRTRLTEESVMPRIEPDPLGRTEARATRGDAGRYRFRRLPHRAAAADPRLCRSRSGAR